MTRESTLLDISSDSSTDYFSHLLNNNTRENNGNIIAIQNIIDYTLNSAVAMDRFPYADSFGQKAVTDVETFYER